MANEHLTTIFKLAEKEDRDSMKASISFLSDVVGTKYVLCNMLALASRGAVPSILG